MEDVLTQLSTDELLRMLELLDMLESKAPIQASDRVRILVMFLYNKVTYCVSLSFSLLLTLAIQMSYVGEVL